MEDAYLQKWQRGETRASPGLAHLGSDSERQQAIDRLIELSKTDQQTMERGLWQPDKPKLRMSS
jgi:hypothetical protein